MSQIAELHAAILQNLPDLTPQEMQEWIGPRRASLRVALAQALIGRRPISLDYGLSLEQMIAAGHYDWKNGNITAERFPLVGSGVAELETKLFHFNRRVSSESAVQLITAADPVRPWHVPKIEHGLSYGAAYPEEQREFPIVMLGSSCQLYGLRYVPVLSAGGSERRLYLNDWDFEWSAHYRFLAVRPVL